MKNLILYIITGIVVSLFLFPFEFVALPGLNTKKALAAMGLVVFFIEMARGKSGILDKDMVVLTVCAALVSLCGYISMVFNNTSDNAYASYIVSMWVWIGAAYMVVWIIDKVHGHSSPRLVATYLAAVCVFQCFMALWIDNSPSVKQFVDTYVEQGQEFLNSHNVERLYGVGASLDVAGSRFGAVLIILAYIMMKKDTTQGYMLFAIVSFLIIGVIGSMMARTTTVGILMAILYILYRSFNASHVISFETLRLWKWAFVILLVLVPLVVYFYNTDLRFQKELRFGFEGFFNLVETGRWETSSTEKLQTMYVFPDNARTWLIGDGYFDNPAFADPYYTGAMTKGFYKGTDVGYLRFIFYFGVLGLAAMTGFIYRAFKICYNRFRHERALFVLLLVLNMVVWFKVSTDIFLIFALFLMVDPDKQQQQLTEAEE